MPSACPRDREKGIFPRALGLTSGTSKKSSKRKAPIDFREEAAVRDLVRWVRDKGYDIRLPGKKEVAEGFEPGRPYLSPPGHLDPFEFREVLRAVEAAEAAGCYLTWYLNKEQREMN